MPIKNPLIINNITRTLYIFIKFYIFITKNMAIFFLHKPYLVGR